MKSVALFGGTFNPIHFGHLAVAEEIRTRLDLDKVIFIPTNLPPHKDPEDLVDAKSRCLMVSLATVSNPCFEVSTFEADRSGKSYSIDTVRHYRRELGEDVRIYFIVGADMLMEISKWKNIEELIRLCRFVAVPRPGFDVRKIFDQYFLSAENLSMASSLLENIMIEDMPLLDVSATAIRRRVKEWKSIKYLVPESVEQFIHNHKLYL